MERAQSAFCFDMEGSSKHMPPETRRSSEVEDAKSFLGRMRRHWWVVGLAAILSLGSCRGAVAAPAGGVVVAVFDGDTVLLDSGEKIRYLGIDAPEVAHSGSTADCYGHEAKALNEKLVRRQRVTLRYDRTAIDVHGRWLAYVFLPDGRCVNAELVAQGCALVFRSAEGFSKLDELLSLQRDAMRNQRGLWGQCRVKPSEYYLGNRRSYIFHRPGCSYGRQTGSSNRTRIDSRTAAFEAGLSPCRRCKP